MKGLDLAERYYHEAVAAVIARRFPLLRDRHAAGLTGYGSDVLGHDDEISRDHEWGPRCFLWLGERDYHRYARALNEALSRELPAAFLGYPTRFRVSHEFGALDQWVSNEDVLIWCKHFRKFEAIYRQRSHERRDDFGDMMI